VSHPFSPQKGSEKLSPWLQARLAVECPYYSLFLSKNPKLTAFKQLDFLNDKKSPPFGFADALTRSCGNALKNSETKVSVKLPRRKQIIMFK
jgi:hypothetical protein